MQPGAITVGLLIFDGVEVLDACGPFEVFSTAGCTGAFILGMAGLLEGRPATTHWSDEDELERRWPTVEVRREPRWVDDGDLITSAGISAGIDASLHVLHRLFGPELAELTAHRMEYEWHDPPITA